MKKVYNKKISNQKVKSKSTVSPGTKKNRNTLYAYLLLAAFVFWSIASVLGIIAFFRTNDNHRSAGMHMITVNADEVQNVDLIDVSNTTWTFNLVLEEEDEEFIYYFYNADGTLKTGSNLSGLVSFQDNTTDFFFIQGTTLINGKLRLRYNMGFGVYDFDDALWGRYSSKNGITVDNSVSFRTITFSSNTYLDFGAYNWLWQNTTESRSEYINISNTAWILNETLPNVDTGPFYFYDHNGLELSVNIGTVSNTLGTERVPIKYIQRAMVGEGYTLFFDDSYTAEYDYTLGKWGYPSKDGFVEKNTYYYRSIVFAENVYCTYDTYTWLIENSLTRSMENGFDLGAEFGYSTGYETGFADGEYAASQLINISKDGILNDASSVVWWVYDPSIDKDVTLVYDRTGLVNLSKTFVSAFPSLVENGGGSNPRSSLRFIFDESLHLTNYVLDFSIDCVQNTISNNFLGAFGHCSIRFTDGQFYTASVVATGTDHTDGAYRYTGTYDFSGVPFLAGRYITELIFYYDITPSDFSYWDYRMYDNNAYAIVGFNAGYDVGYKKGQASLSTDLIKQYDAGFNAGQKDGYITGYSAGVNATNVYTFDSLLSAVVDVPLRYFRSLFNFEILGINLSNFFLSLLTILIVLAVVKLLL